MQLFYKVYFFLMMLMIVILVGAGYIGYHREVALFQDDMEKDARLLGKALSGMVEHTWNSSGADKALELIRDANIEESRVRIRWVDLEESSAGTNAPRAPLNRTGPVLKGASVSLIVRSGNERYRVTYVPVAAGNGAHGAIELAESLTFQEKYTRNSLLHLLMTTILILLTAGGLFWFHFRQWIHRPLILFTEKSRRIGQGDLAPDLVVRGRDEFAVLGQTLNSMCRELAASLEAVRVENQRRLEAMEQLRHSERLATLGRLSAGMAHEIGTPLNVISGRSKQIRSGGLDPGEIIEFAGIIEEQTRRIVKIMQNLLDFARRRKPNPSLQDMETVVGQVVEMLAPTARKAGVAVAVVKHGEIPTVPVDRIQIQQVVTNLVMNGIQSMDKGGRLELALAAEIKQHPEKKSAPGNYLTVRIMDEGPGVAPEIRGHIFEPFFTTKDVGEGTGLGLSIAYGIIQEHKGWIEVDNRPEGGACFTIFLPA